MPRRARQLAVLLALSLSGCATANALQQMRDRWDPRVSVYTYCQVVLELGFPVEEQALPNGSKVAMWRHHLGRRRGVATLRLTFGPGKVLQAWSWD
jgi:hypothetical protein